MKTTNTLFTILAFAGLVSFVSCGGNTDNSKPKEETKPIETTTVETAPKELAIVGKNIWVRDVPTTGEVVLKLNEGDKCEIIEKGKFETINNVTDYWYKIKFNNKIGWLFGSQTSIKQAPADMEVIKNKFNKDFETYLNGFIDKCYTGQNLRKMLIKNEVTLFNFSYKSLGMVRFFNPGVSCNAFYKSDKYGFITDYEGKAESSKKINIFNKEPKGDMCEGYPNQPNGAYYFPASKLPTSWDMENNKSIKLKLPEECTSAPIMNVLVIKDAEQTENWYFLYVNNAWYFYIIYDCDCSA